MGDKPDTLGSVLQDVLINVTDELARIVTLKWRKGGAIMQPEDRRMQRATRIALGGAAVVASCGSLVIALLYGFTPLRAATLAVAGAFASCSMLIFGTVIGGVSERNTKRRIQIEVDRIQAAHENHMTRLYEYLDIAENTGSFNWTYDEENAAWKSLDDILTQKQRGGRPATQLTDDDLAQLDATQTAYKAGGWKAFNSYCGTHRLSESTMRDRMRRYARQLAEWRARNKPPGGIVA